MRPEFSASSNSSPTGFNEGPLLSTSLGLCWINARAYGGLRQTGVVVDVGRRIYRTQCV